MREYYYDLHIHSCLSPCADDDMTPGNIAGMAVVNGLDIVALTDHNSSKNCPAFFSFAKKYGIIPIPGMELTTSEEIHILCLFATLEDAMDFDRFIDGRRIKIKNKKEIFGNQFVTDENDEVISEDDDLLINATSIDIEEAYAEVMKRGGACLPAHIDRESGGMISVLGDMPDSPDYSAFELNMKDSYEEYITKYPKLKTMRYLVSSDAHHLWNINGKDNRIELDDEPYSSAKVRQSLIRYLRGE